MAQRETDPAARLILSADEPGPLWLDQVFLFPRDTWQTLGLRPDLAQMLAAMKPGADDFRGLAFRRSYSGGCLAVEGDPRRRGTVLRRLEHPGLPFHGRIGLLDYLELTAGIGAQPIYDANIGMAEKGFVPDKVPGPWI